MNDYIQIKENKGLLRDGFSKAILNIDRDALSQHRNKKKIMKELIENSNKILTLENELSEIRNLLSELLKEKY
jgi:hypothetical protein